MRNFVVLAVWPRSCAGAGLHRRRRRASSSSASAHFAPGVTTREEAIKALGPPSSVYEAANGEKTLSWARDGGLFNGDETRQYAVVFGPDDKMIRTVPSPQR